MIAELATVGRSLRPAELAALAFPGAEPGGVRVLRTHQWIEHDGTGARCWRCRPPCVAPAAEVGA